MPINRFHAFATGITFPLAVKRPSGLSARLGQWLALKLSTHLQNLQIQEVVNSFEQECISGPHCQVGPNAWCVNFSAKEQIILGEGVICRGILRSESFHPGKIVIGDYVYIGDDCIISCAEHIEIGRMTLLAHGVQIFDNNSHPIGAQEREEDYLAILKGKQGSRHPIDRAPIWIGERVWVGFNTIILKGVRIGSNSIIAASSVVTTDIPPNCIAAGNPARVIKTLSTLSDNNQTNNE